MHAAKRHYSTNIIIIIICKNLSKGISAKIYTRTLEIYPLYGSYGVYKLINMLWVLPGVYVRVSASLCYQIRANDG